MMVDVGDRRTSLRIAEAVKELKEQRKATRAVMQRYEGASDLSEDEKTTYAHLTQSMVVLNALSDQILKHEFLPRTWDRFTFGSEFDRHLTPLLRTNDEGELWVEYFVFDRPRDMLVFLAGKSADAVPEQAATMRKRPAATAGSARPKHAPASGDMDLMDLIRARMPNRSKAFHYAKDR
jgi:hypothetical protein